MISSKVRRKAEGKAALRGRRSFITWPEDTALTAPGRTRRGAAYTEPFKQKFKIFSNLPFEIRAMIWKLAVPDSRIIEMNYHYTLKCDANADGVEDFFFMTDKQPADDETEDALIENDSSLENRITETVRLKEPPISLLHVNRESRAETLRSYKRISDAAPSSALFSPEKDTIYFSYGKGHGMGGHGCCTPWDDGIPPDSSEAPVNAQTPMKRFLFAKSSWNAIRHLAIDAELLNTIDAVHVLYNLKGLTELTIVTHEVNPYRLSDYHQHAFGGRAASPRSIGKICQDQWEAVISQRPTHSDLDPISPALLSPTRNSHLGSANIRLVTPSMITCPGLEILDELAGAMTDLETDWPEWKRPRLRLKTLTRNGNKCCSTPRRLAERLRGRGEDCFHYSQAILNERHPLHLPPELVPDLWEDFQDDEY